MSESHENSQNLTIEHLNAIDLLVQGLSDRESGDLLDDVLGKDAKFARLVQERLSELKGESALT